MTQLLPIVVPLSVEIRYAAVDNYYLRSEEFFANPEFCAKHFGAFSG